MHKPPRPTRPRVVRRLLRKTDIETFWTTFTTVSLLIDPWLIRQSKKPGSPAAWRVITALLIGSQLAFFLFVLILIGRSLAIRAFTQP